MTKTRFPYNKNLKEKSKQLRKSGNLSEVLLWQQIKNKQFLEIDFHRQRIVGNYIVDFFCKKLNLVIEIDGSSHNNKENYDKNREKYLQDLGLNIIHILDVDIKGNLEGVLQFLKIEIRKVKGE